MFWRVLIIPQGVRAQLCMGTSPEKVGEEQKKIDRTKLVNRRRIQILFTYDFDDRRSIDDLLSDRWIYTFRVDEKSIFADEVDKIAEKYGAKGTIRMAHGFEMIKSTLTDHIDVLADLDADDYDEFNKKYSGIDGAIDILFSTTRVFTPGDPSKNVMKWVKKLELEKEEF